MLTPLGIPVLTAPFNIATWLLLLPKRHFAPVPNHERRQGDRRSPRLKTRRLTRTENAAEVSMPCSLRTR